MKVRRIVTNIAIADTAKAKVFYQDLLGLDLLMDHGWIKTFGSGINGSVSLILGFRSQQSIALTPLIPVLRAIYS